MIFRINYYTMPGLIKKPVQAKYIIQFVADALGYNYKDVLVSGRQRKFSMARNMCYTLIRQNTVLTLTETARIFKKDHTTVIHGLRVHENDMRTDELYAETFNEIEFLLKLQTPKTRKNVI